MVETCWQHEATSSSGPLAHLLTILKSTTIDRTSSGPLANFEKIDTWNYHLKSAFLELLEMCYAMVAKQQNPACSSPDRVDTLQYTMYNG